MMLQDSHLRWANSMFLMGTNAVSQVCQLVDQVTILCIPPPSNPR